MPAANFKYLPNVADVAFVARGKTFKEALESSGAAILNLMFDMKELKKDKSKVRTLRISDSAPNRNELTWFILQKIVSKVDEKGVQAFRFKVNRITEARGRIKVNGCIFYKKSRTYLSLLDVKAVTPHELEVKGSAGKKWSIKAILDV
ncbi:MAG: archease [Candidatus Micrarchaeota archaeon]|nr:archease [Candidatus Micrarchaeota archaeon]